MTRYCVILSGRLPGEKSDAEVWAPLVMALKQEQADFAAKILPMVPLLIRQNLDESVAHQLTQRLRSVDIDAQMLPDEQQLAYLERQGNTRGPLPLSGLGEFIRPGERYRLLNSQEWSVWNPATRTAGAPEPAIEKTPTEAHLTERPLAPFGPAEAANDIDAYGDAEPVATHQGISEPPPSTPQTTNPAPQSLWETATASEGMDTSIDTLEDAPVEEWSSTMTPLAAGVDYVDYTDIPATSEPETSDTSAITESTPISPPSPIRSPVASRPVDLFVMRMLWPVGRSWLAIAAGYMGLLAIIPFIAPISLVVSILAWRDLSLHPEKRGRGRTIFGLIMGGLITLICAIGLSTSLYESIREARDAPLTTAHPVRVRDHRTPALVSAASSSAYASTSQPDGAALEASSAGTAPVGTAPVNAASAKTENGPSVTKPSTTRPLTMPVAISSRDKSGH